MSQGSRTKTINRFKRNEIKVLVATDLASRGIDVKHITHVINYDLPRFAEDYVHRIGRTGRAEQTGRSLLFYTDKERSSKEAIEKLMGIEVKSVPGMEAKNTQSDSPTRKKGRSGKKRPFFKSAKSFKNQSNAQKRMKSKGPKASVA